MAATVNVFYKMSSAVLFTRYSRTTDQWSGYGVIQAKCKAKPEGTEKDQKWALGLLEEELDLFVTSAKRSPKPEYYVYVTNVDLAAGGRGCGVSETERRERP